jgi:hypothetical protein
MLKSLILLSSITSAALFAIGPAATAGSTAAVSPPSVVLDLEKVPVKPVAGSPSISAVADGDDFGEAEDSGPPWIKKSVGGMRAVLADDGRKREIEDDD